ncbi:MAG: zinc-binding dehydrogenase [Marmoricola sp.]
MSQDQQPPTDHIMVIGPDGQPVAVPAEGVQDDAVPFEQAPRAHELMESGSHSGKILLVVGE